VKAVLVYADGRIDRRLDGGQQWITVADDDTMRCFKACEVAHTATGHDGGALGAFEMVYAEQPRYLYEKRIVAA
jgi:hypothetical protein